MSALILKKAIKLKKINLGNIKLEVDIESTVSFYVSQNGFVCDCSDCTSYVNNIPKVQKSFNGLDKVIGIDLLKDVGQGMDELMAHADDYNDRSLVVVQS